MSGHGRPTENELAKDQVQLAERRTSLADLRSHLANERTHLAYVRTGIALIGFGITLNRFGLLFAGVGERARTPRAFGLYSTESVGLVMASLGVLLMGWALLRYRAVSRDIERGVFTSRFQPVSVLTLVLVVFGCLATAWLMLE